MATLKFKSDDLLLVAARVICPAHGFIENMWVKGTDIQPGYSDEEIVEVAMTVMEGYRPTCRRCGAVCEVA